MQRPLESAQYTSAELSVVMASSGVLASVGSTGDCYDNAMAESLVDTYKTELIADRVWRSRAQVKIATVEWVGWYNHTRLHGELGDVPPAEFEALHAPWVAAVEASHSSPFGLAVLSLDAPTPDPTTLPSPV